MILLNRPQMLVLMKPEEDAFGPKYPRLLDLVVQLKAGQGLTVVASVLPGHITNRDTQVAELEQVRGLVIWKLTAWCYC